MHLRHAVLSSQNRLILKRSVILIRCNKVCIIGMIPAGPVFVTGASTQFLDAFLQMDVGDSMLALQGLISQGTVDAKRVAVVGGSHGGFLTGHLLGQHANAFQCGALRNPVLDLSLMVNVRYPSDARRRNEVCQMYSSEY